jgi:glucose/arabinose dehydrogenase
MKSRSIPLLGLLVLLASGSCTADIALEQIRLPQGFKIEIYAEGVKNARQMALGDKGTLFVGSRKAGLVHAVVDTDGDQRADQVYVIARDLNLPSGLAFRDGSLYIGAVSTIYRLDGIEDRLDKPPELTVVNDTFPDKTYHGWKYLGFGPDGKLYVPVGAPCNICLEPGFAAIKRMNPDGSELEDFASGVRNSVGFDWHPETGELWFTDNGRDMLGDDIPACELNHAPQSGLHFGFPHCHGGDIPDPDYANDRKCSEFSAPAHKLGAHVAPLGMKFYTGKQFPAEYHKQIFIAEHGSWNRSQKSGYRITQVRLQQGKAVAYEVFAEGWLQGQENWGRPADLLVMPDGALLVADDQAGVIYRISYQE